MPAYDIFCSAVELHKSGKYPDAIKKYQFLCNDEKVFSELVSKNQEAVILNLSSLLRRDKLYDKAISLLKSALNKTANTSFIAAVHNNLGNCYRDQGLP